MSELEIFVRQVRDRSAEHKKAIELLADARLPGQIISILRQELDSMIRVIYLLSVPTDRRLELLSSSISGQRWRKERSLKLITDREMVDLTQKLYGWTLSVYKFGCAFIHLSALHDYKNREPMRLISAAERDDLIQHCRYYHGGPTVAEPTFVDFIPYLPAVFEKISTNLDYYLDELLEEKGLEHV